MFHCLNTKYVAHSLNVDIQNIDASDEHWRSNKYIFQMAEELEMLLYSSDTFVAVEKELIEFLLLMNQQNKRIEELKFFIDPTDKATFVCLCISDIVTFKPQNFLKRNIIIDFTKQNKRLLFTDITKDEWKQVNSAESNKILPPTWLTNDKLTKKYNRYKELFL